RLAETTGRQPDALLVVEAHATAHHLVDLLHGALVPHGEGKLLGRRAGHRHDRHLAFPGLADPALAREFLHPARPFAGRVAPFQRGPEVAGDQRRDHQQADQDAELADPTLIERRHLVLLLSSGEVGPRLSLITRDDASGLLSRASRQGVARSKTSSPDGPLRTRREPATRYCVTGERI